MDGQLADADGAHGPRPEPHAARTAEAGGAQRPGQYWLVTGRIVVSAGHWPRSVLIVVRGSVLRSEMCCFLHHFHPFPSPYFYMFCHDCAFKITFIIELNAEEILANI